MIHHRFAAKLAAVAGWFYCVLSLAQEPATWPQSSGLARDGQASAWTLTERSQNKLQGELLTPVLVGGHVCTHPHNPRFVCIDLTAGKESWISTPFGKYRSLVTQVRKYLTLDERSDLLLINANPEKFELVDHWSTAIKLRAMPA